MRLLAFLYNGFLALGSTNQSIDISRIRSNILFIFSDDHAYQAISTYGHDLILPHRIDRLTELIQVVKSELKKLQIQYKDTIRN